MIARPDWTPEQAEAMWRGVDRAMHGSPSVPAPERCWKDVGGQECGEPATTAVGLCGLCLAQMQEAPVMPIPAPPSMPAQTGCGRR